MKKPPEIIPGDKKIRQDFLILIALYILLVVYLEPLIDFILVQFYQPFSEEEFVALNKMKVLISRYAQTIVIVLPMLLIAWFGYRIFASAKLPPGKMRLPFKVPLIKGKNAQLIGLMIMTLSFLVLIQSLVFLAKNLI